MEQTAKVYEIHAFHREALNILAFYADDLKILRKRIEEVVSRNTGKDILAQAEHFQNQLIIQQNEMEDLRKAIKESENNLEDGIKSNPVAADRRSVPNESGLRLKLATYEKLFQEMRVELYTFLSSVM